MARGTLLPNYTDLHTGGSVSVQIKYQNPVWPGLAFSLAKGARDPPMSPLLEQFLPPGGHGNDFDRAQRRKLPFHLLRWCDDHDIHLVRVYVFVHQTLELT